MSIIGVELFFVLSGFVLAPQILKLETNPNKFLKIFLFRRWIRTIPPYIVALICAAIVFGFGDELNFLKFLTYTQNIIADNSITNFFPVAWSLSIEEWFYVYLPITILLCSKLRRTSFKLNVLVICVTTIIVLNTIRIFYSVDVENWGEDIRRSVVFRIDSLCFGVVAYLFKDKIRKSYLWLLNMVTIALVLYVLIDPFLLSKNALAQKLFFPLSSIGFSTILMSLTFVNSVSARTKLIGNFGANISYSMYLFHIFFISYTASVFSDMKLALVTYIFSLILFCWLFFTLFEKPLLKLRPKYE